LPRHTKVGDEEADEEKMRCAFTPWRTFVEADRVKIATRAHAHGSAYSGNSDGDWVRVSLASQAAPMNARILRFW